MWVEEEALNTILGLAQTTSAARDFYTQKVADLVRNLQDLEKIISSKQSNLYVVEDGELLDPFKVAKNLSLLFLVSDLDFFHGRSGSGDQTFGERERLKLNGSKSPEKNVY